MADLTDSAQAVAGPDPARLCALRYGKRRSGPVEVASRKHYLVALRLEWSVRVAIRCSLDVDGTFSNVAGEVCDPCNLQCEPAVL